MSCLQELKSVSKKIVGLFYRGQGGSRRHVPFGGRVGLVRGTGHGDFWGPPHRTAISDNETTPGE